MLLSTCLIVLALLLKSTTASPSAPELSRRQNETGPNGPLPGWAFVGCFTDSNAGSRTLQQGAPIVLKTMTPKLCTTFCGANFPVTDFAGVEFSDECYCDYDIQGTATKVDDALCNFPCAGDPVVSCGGASLISIFQNLKSVSPVPQNIPKLGPWTFDGCFTDAVGSNPRTLQERFNVVGGVTIEGCTSVCDSKGFNISGMEFGTECWCGSSFALPAAQIAAPVSDCSKACQAEPTELCGAANRLAIYLKDAPSATSSAAVMPATAAPTSSATPA